MIERADRVRQLAGQRVLVTGARGFLGSHLVARLGEAAAAVFAVSRRPAAPAAPGVTWRQADLGEPAAAESLVREVRPDLVYHLAGLVTAAPGRELVVPVFQSLLASTVYLLDAVATRGCGRLVLIGSLVELGAFGEDGAPSSPYVAAKWASTMYGRMFTDLYGTPVVIPRLGFTYGPGQDARKLVPSVMLAALRGDVPRLTSGQLRADWLYVDDTIDALLAVATAPDVVGATLDVGSGTLTSVREIAERIVALCGGAVRPEFGVVPDRPGERCRAADVAATAARLGWRAETSLEAGLVRTLEWWRSHLSPAASRPSGSPGVERGEA